MENMENRNLIRRLIGTCLAAWGIFALVSVIIVVLLLG
jgi:hypothetical protein